MNDLTTDLLRTAPLAGTILLGLLLILLNAWKRESEPWQFAMALAGLAINIGLALAVSPWNGYAFHRMILTGGYASVTAILFLGAAMLTIALSRSHLRKIGVPFGEFYILIVLAASGMIVFAAGTDLIATFMGLEILSICLYVLAGFSRGAPHANEASLKYFLLGAFASGFFLYGMALIYGVSGSTNLLDIARQLPALASQPLFLTGAALLAIGFAFKVGAVPFHFWVPDVYQGAPTVVTAFMAAGAKAAAFCSLAMVFMLTVNIASTPLRDVFAILATASMILGNLVAVAQTNVKRMLAYSSIAHAGYLLIGIATATPDALSGVLFYLVAYALTTIGAFGIVALLENSTQDGGDIEQFRGLSSRRPLLAVFLSVFLFSLIGLPPFAGFFGKYYIFYAAITGGLTWLTIVGIVTSMVSLYYYLRVIVAMYFEEGVEPQPVASDVPSTVALVVSFAGVLLLGVFPGLLLDLIPVLRLAP